MNTVSTSITPMQWMFMVATFVAGAILRLSSFMNILKQSSWMAVVSGYLLSLVVLAIYFKLISAYPDKNLIQINEVLFGKILGKVVSCLYLFFFYMLAVMNIQDVSGFLTNYIMQETPAVAINALIVLVCVLAVRKGIESIARFSPLLTILQVSITVLLSVLVIKHLKTSNLLPLFDISIKHFIQGTHTATTFVYCDVLVLLMIVPNPINTQKNRKGFLVGLTIGACVLFVVVLLITATLGPVLSYFAMARYEAIRYINVLDIFSRMETLFALALIVMRFFKVSVLLYASAAALAQICELKSYLPLVSVMGALATIGSLFILGSASEASEWSSNTTAVFSSFFQIVLPLISLGLCLIKAKIKKPQTG